MDESDIDAGLENSSSSDLDSHLNSLIKDISDDDCDSICCSQQVIRHEKTEATVIYTLSPENQNDLTPFDHLTEDKHIHHLHSNSNDGERTADRPVVEELNSRRINSCSQNAIVKCTTPRMSSSHHQLVLQMADKTTNVTDAPGFRNTRKHSYPYTDLALGQGLNPSSSWPTDSSKLRKLKHTSHCKPTEINVCACQFKSQLLKNGEYRTQSQELFLKEMESLPKLFCCRREQMAGVVSESLDSQVNMLTNASQSVCDASLSQESLFDDFETVARVADELVSVKDSTQNVTLSTTVAPVLHFNCATSSQAFALSPRSKKKASLGVKALDPFKLSMPLVTEQAVSPVSTLIPTELPSQTGANYSFSVYPLKPQEFAQIPEPVSHEACCHIEGARQAELSVADEARQAELSVIDEARQAELSVADEARQTELSVTDEARQAELSVTDEARQAELSVADEARQAELSVADEARQAELSVTDEARQAELSVADEARQAELSVADEARQAELSVADEARQAELSVADEARQAELSVTDEARQAELSVADEARQAELSVTDEARQVELSVTDEARQAELSVTDEARQAELSVADEARQAELPSTEKVTQPKLLIIEARQAEQPLIKEADETQMKEQTFLSNFLEASCRDIQSKPNKNVLDSPHALEYSHLVGIIPQHSETVSKSVCLRKDETFLDATKMIKINEGSSENVCESSHTLKTISAIDTSLEYVMSACDRGAPKYVITACDRDAPKSQQYQYKTLVSDNIRRLDCEYQEMPRSPPVLLNMDGIPYLLPSSDHIVPQYEQTLPEEITYSTGVVNNRTVVTDGVDNSTGVTDGVDNSTGVTDVVDNSTGVTDGVFNSTGVTDGVDNRTVVTDGVDNSTGVTDGVDNSTGVTGVVDNSTGVTDGVDNSTGVTDGVDNSTGVTDGVDNSTEVTDGVDNSTGVTDGVDNSTGVTNGVDNSTGVTNGVDNSTGVTGVVDNSTGVTGVVDNSTGVTDGVDNSTGVTDGVDNSTGVTDGVDNSTGVTDGVGNSTGVTDGVNIKTGVTDGVDSSTGVTDGVDNSMGVTDGVDNSIGVTNGVDNSTGVTGVVDNSTGVTDGVDNSTGVTDAVNIRTGVTGAVKNSTGATDGVDNGTRVTDGVFNSTGVTDGDNTCKGSKQTVQPSVQESHSTVSITDSVDTNEALSNQKITSSCTSYRDDSSTRICLNISPDLHERQETAAKSPVNDLLLGSLENQAHSHRSYGTSLEDTVICEEQKVPEAESCQDLSLNEMSMYSDIPEDKHRDLKCKTPIKQVFQWKSVHETAISKSLTDQPSDSVLDRLSAIVPIVQSHRPLRVGLSRKQKVKHLHNKP